MSSARDATVVVPTLGGERLERMLRSVAGGEAQVIVVDNGSGDGVARTCADVDGVEVVRLPENVGYTRAVNIGAQRADGELLVLLNDDCVCDPGLRRADHRADRPGRRRGDGGRRDARLARPVADRQRRDGARPHPARLRLPERRAALAAGDRRRRPDRPLGGRRGLRPLDVPLGRRLRRAALRLLGGRRPGDPPAPPGAALRARPGRARRPRALGDPRLGLGAQELPDGLRARATCFASGRC